MSRLPVILLCVFAVGFLFAVDAKDDDLAKELKLLEEEVAQANKKCLKLEHDAVYTNAVCKVAYSEVKRVEKELLVKRQILSDKLESLPEIHQARAERQKAYARMLSFKKRTGLIQRKEKK